MGSMLIVASLTLALLGGGQGHGFVYVEESGRLPPDTTLPGTSSTDGDVDLFVAEGTDSRAARITNAGAITEGKAVKGSEPFGITVAPEADPWYTMMAADKIAVLRLR